MKIIPLTKGQVAMVDDLDYPMLIQFPWNAVFNGRVWYAANSTMRKRMHHLIMPLEKPFTVDHIDGDGLNNQRCNLRPATPFQNNLNHKKARKFGDSKCSSQYKGVSWHKKNKTWTSYITVNFKRIYLGSFKNEIEAAKEYDLNASKNFGEYANLNFKG